MSNIVKPYDKHIFVCTNQKTDDKVCCAAAGGRELFLDLKKQILDLALSGVKNVRVSQSGCLGHCKFGPCVVVYPEAKWYLGVTLSNVEQIVNNLLGELSA